MGRINKFKQFLGRDFGMIIFLALVILTFVPVLSINIFNNNRHRELIEQDAHNKNSIIIEKSQYLINIYFENIETDLKSLAELPEVKTLDSSMTYDILEATKRENNMIEEIFIANKLGESIFTTSDIALNIGNESFFKGAMTSKNKDVNTYIKSDGERINLTYTTPIKIEDENKGVIGVSVNLKALEQLLQVYREEYRDLFLMTTDGVVLSADQHVVEEQLVEEIKNRQGTSERSIYSHQSFTTSKYSVDYVALDGNALYLVTRIDNEVIFEVIRQNNIIYGIINFLLLLIIIVVAYFLSLYFTKPLNELTVPIKIISEGNMDVEVSESVLKRRDQFGELARSFTTMLDKIKNLTYYDTLLHIPNRLFFFNKIENLLNRVNTNYQLLGVVYIDLDNFKSINDAWGSGIGDKVLKQIVSKLSSKLGKEYFLARLDGDEMAVIIPICDEEKVIENAVKKIYETLNNIFYIGHTSIPVAASIGAAIYPKDGNDVTELLRNTNVALEKAKMSSGKHYQLYDVMLDEEATWYKEIENDLHTAIENNEFEMYYQPLYDLTEDKLHGAEALIRWHHPKYGFVSPEVFIPIAEEGTDIIDIGEWVVRTVCLQNKKWESEGLEDVVVSLNISTKHFIQENFVDFIKSALNVYQYNPELMKIEITETLAVSNEELTLTTQKRLQALGVKIALDDFGTGYSSLSYLSKFVFDVIKIDKAFLMALGNNERDDLIVSSIITIGKILGAKIIAEGVEEQEHVDFLKENGCDIAQGYYYSRPLPADQFYEYAMNLNNNVENNE